jgi:heme/copper-type cytochrome/quinol oxidase subunit 2
MMIIMMMMMRRRRRRRRRITTTAVATTTITVTAIITICNDFVSYRIDCYSSNTPDLYLEVLSLHLNWGISYLEAFLGFTWSLQANAGIVSHTVTYFRIISSSLTSLPFDTVECEILTALVNKP